MPGMVTRLGLEANKPGTFPGISAQFSGDGFSDMHFTTVAMPAEDYRKWLANAQSSSPVLDDAAYKTLLQPSEANPAQVFRVTQPGLFEKMLAESAPGSDTQAQYQPVTAPIDSSTLPRTKE
jgi:cytochrome o ubiquinol oxidase subunit 2